MAGVPLWAAPYIGLPFVKLGRDLSGIDCEGLNRLVMQREAGDPPIPPYIVSPYSLVAVARAIRDSATLPPWLAVERAALKKFDWVFMTGDEKVDGRRRELICHLGIMVTERLVLHIEEASDSVAVPLDHPTIRYRLKGFVRHEALA